MITAETTIIRATSRESVKIKDNFFTVEFTEERAIHIDPKTPKNKIEEELDEARRALWDRCNEEVDNQIQDIYKYVANS